MDMRLPFGLISPEITTAIKVITSIISNKTVAVILRMTLFIRLMKQTLAMTVKNTVYTEEKSEYT